MCVCVLCVWFCGSLASTVTTGVAGGRVWWLIGGGGGVVVVAAARSLWPIVAIVE